MSGWNYRVVRCKDRDGEPWYGLFEVYYDDNGKPNGRTEEPATFVCDGEEGVEGIRGSLAMALDGVLHKPVLSDEELSS